MRRRVRGIVHHQICTSSETWTHDRYIKLVCVLFFFLPKMLRRNVTLPNCFFSQRSDIGIHSSGVSVRTFSIITNYFTIYYLDYELITETVTRQLHLACARTNRSFYLNSEKHPRQTVPEARAEDITHDLGLHCFPMPLLWDARHKWIKFWISPLNHLLLCQKLLDGRQTV